MMRDFDRLFPSLQVNAQRVGWICLLTHYGLTWAPNLIFFVLESRCAMQKAHENSIKHCPSLSMRTQWFPGKGAFLPARQQHFDGKLASCRLTHCRTISLGALTQQLGHTLTSDSVAPLSIWCSWSASQQIPGIVLCTTDAGTFCDLVGINMPWYTLPEVW